MIEENGNLVEVKIGALIMDPNTNTPIVVLKGIDSETVLPIWVGAFEANAIALEVEKVVPQRPMTHDLLRNLVIECGLTASRVVITDLLDNTFYASIELTDEAGDPMMLDSRPSDAIALALLRHLHPHRQYRLGGQQHGLCAGVDGLVPEIPRPGAGSGHGCPRPARACQGGPAN